MRLTALMCAAMLTASAPPYAQTSSSVPLAGFRYVRVHPPQYTDGTVDPHGLASYLESLLGKQGWSLLRGSEDMFKPDARQMASQAIQCSIGFDYEGFGTTAHLDCADVLGRDLFRISGKGVAISEGGELKAALRDVAKRLQAMRPRFDSTQTIDIVSRLPPVETYALTADALDDMSKAGKLRAQVEGLWATTDQSAYRLGIVSVQSGREFIAVILESPNTYVWQPGMVKAHLTAAADGQTFFAKWSMGNRRETTGLAILKGGTLTIAVEPDGKQETITLIKLHPTGEAASPRPSPPSSRETVMTSTGTGFLCAPGIVATNHHVIEGAGSVELYLPLQKRSVKLQLVVSDAANDVALLRVIGDEGDGLPPSLPLVDSGTVRLGAQAFVIGFPLGDVLGSDHKVTSGLVSALDGLRGDPRELQLTVPIQPGSSGSPVFDSFGRVIGVVTSSLDTLAALRAAGQLPQNVNFALKSDYLALLLKRVPTAKAEPASSAPAAQFTDLVERLRASVGQVRAYR